VCDMIHDGEVMGRHQDMDKGLQCLIYIYTRRVSALRAEYCFIAVRYELLDDVIKWSFLFVKRII